MRKSKTIALCLLAASLCLGACAPAAKDRNPAKTAEGTEAEKETGEKEDRGQEEETGEDGEVTDASQGGEISQEAEDRHLLSLITSLDGNYRWGEEKPLCHTRYARLWLDTREAVSSRTGALAFPELAAALEERNNRTRERMEESIKELEAQAREMEGNEAFPELSREEEVWVVRGDSEVLSLLMRESSYEGGAHGQYIYTGITLDSRSGKETALEELVTDPQALVELAADRLVEKYPDVQFFEPPKEVMLKELKEGSLSWVVGYDGLTFYFSPYDLAPYANGALTVTILYEEKPELFASRICQVPQAWAVRLAPGMEYDLGHDRTLDTVEVWTDFEEEGVAYTGLSVSVNGQERNQKDLWFYQFTPYVVRSDDLNTELLVVETVSDNDYKTTMVCSLNPDEEDFGVFGQLDSTGFSGCWEEKEDGTFESGTEIFANPKHFSLMTRMNLLSTYNGIRWYGLCEEAKEEGYLKPEQPWYEVERREDPLTLLVPLDMEVGEGGKVETFPEGTRLWIVRTDGEYVEFVTEDDRTCRVYMESAEWPGRIRGVEDKDVTEIFDGMMFAG